LGKTALLLLVSLACILLIVAGCTSTTGPAPETTAAPTTAAVTLPVTAAPSPADPDNPWSGTWNTTWKLPEGEVDSTILLLEQTGDSVTGLYDDGLGTIIATVQGDTLTGMWTEADATDDTTGPLEFVLSADKNSFSGRWASAGNGPDALSTSTEFWNGVRV
jgi:hypothetical protein